MCGPLLPPLLAWPVNNAVEFFVGVRLLPGVPGVFSRLCSGCPGWCLQWPRDALNQAGSTIRPARHAPMVRVRFVVTRTMLLIERLLFEFLNGVHFPLHAALERFLQNLHRPYRSFASPLAPVQDRPHGCAAT